MDLVKGSRLGCFSLLDPFNLLIGWDTCTKRTIHIQKKLRREGAAFRKGSCACRVATRSTWVGTFLSISHDTLSCLSCKNKGKRKYPKSSRPCAPKDKKDCKKSCRQRKTTGKRKQLKCLNSCYTHHRFLVVCRMAGQDV